MEKNKLQHYDIATNKLFDDIRGIIEQGRGRAYAAVNQIAVLTYWHIGRRIVEEEQHGKARAQYGTQLIKTLAEQLMPKYGNTFNKRNLDYFRQFYSCFDNLEIVNTCVHNLTWSHFRSIIQVADPKAREWYVKEASEQMWSVRTLNRNIGTQYYGRRMACAREGLTLPSPDIEASDPLEYIKNDNPTIGILLCTETDKVMAKYSVLNGSEQLFAAKYMAYMPTEEELSREIEQQKRFFLEQHGKGE